MENIERKKRAEKLSIDFLYQGVKNKVIIVEEGVVTGGWGAEVATQLYRQTNDFQIQINIWLLLKMTGFG